MNARLLVTLLGLASAIPAQAVVVGGSTTGTCSAGQVTTCGARGGVPVAQGGSCVCKVISYTPAYVSNANRGDVALVPVNDGKGEEAVRAIMNSLAQNHRHTLIYLDDHTVRHATSYPLANDDIGATTRGLRIKPGALMNAPPGAITQTTDEAMAEGWNRLGTTGLVLKPALTKAANPFAPAATVSESVVGTYRIADYSKMIGMTLPLSGDPTRDELRGTMCSGFVHYAFTRAGFTISKHTYSQAVREQAALALYDSVKTQVRSAMTGTQLTFYPRGPEEIANQVVNCFAGLGCDDTHALWSEPNALGQGESVSPDNLLPTSFVLRGSGRYAGWGDTGLASGATADNSDTGAASTPFRTIELQNTVGRVYTTTTLTDW